MKKLHKLLVVLSLLVILVLKTQVITAQSTAPADTASYPYWIEMMQNPNANFFATQSAFYKYWENRPITKGCGYKPFKRWEYMMQSRVDQYGNKPAPDKIYNEYVAYQSRKSTDAYSGNWQSQGPFILPADKGYEGLGRINAIAFHPTDPNIIYIGAPAGGLWKTTVGGNEWTTTTDVLPTLGVSSIVIHPSNPDIIYIGTGDRDASDAPGMGVMKSTDGGNTWLISNTGMGNVIVGDMLIDSSNPLILIAATSAGIFKSINGGASWLQKKAGNFKDIAFKPFNTSVVYGTSSGNFYKSTDNGETWQQISNGLEGNPRAVIAVTPANPEVVYLMASKSDNGFLGIYKSTNEGNSFTRKSNSPNIFDWSCDGSGSGGQAWYDMALAVDQNNADIIYAGGVDIWKSTNGGTSWQINAHWYGGCGKPAVHADQHIFTVNPLNGKIYAGNDGGIYWTDNGGSNWHEISSGLAISQAYKIGQSAQIDDLVVNGYQDNGSSILENGTWYAIGGGDGMECAIDYTNSNYRYTTVYYGTIDRVYGQNGQGAIAGKDINGITEEGDWVTPFIIDENDPNTMFIGYKNVWRSRNIKASNTGQVSWTKISSLTLGNLKVIEQSPVNTDILLVANDGSIYYSTNAQSANPIWKAMQGLPGSGKITDIECDPENEQGIFITRGIKVYKTSDLGQNWLDISGSLPQININTIVYRKNSREGLYIGTDAGVYYKDASLNDWIQFSQGLPASSKITELEIFYDNSNPANDRIKAGTFGRGLWKSDMYFADPQADFTSSRQLIPPGCSINFKDLSTGVPNEWIWSFQGGEPANSYIQNPQNIVFNNPGQYTVQLIVTNAAGESSIIKQAYITVSDTLKPAVDFDASAHAICFDTEIIEFYDKSENCPTSWKWQFSPSTINFVNGTNQFSENPQVVFLNKGRYNVSLTVTNSNGSRTLTKNEYIAVGGFLLPYEENFENASLLSGWSIENPDEDKTWSFIETNGLNGSSMSAWMDLYTYSAPPGRRDKLITPALDFTGLSEVYLTFDHAYASRYSNTSDSLIIYISDDCGTTWSRVFGTADKGAGTFATAPKTTNPFFPAIADDWCGNGWGSNCYTIDLSQLANYSAVKLAFESWDRLGNNLFIDNVKISNSTDNKPVKELSEFLNVYPNPADRLCTIVFGKAISNYELRIVDQLGKECLSKKGDNSSIQNLSLDVSDLAAGVYIISVATADNSWLKKLIIQ